MNNPPGAGHQALPPGPEKSALRERVHRPHERFALAATPGPSFTIGTRNDEGASRVGFGGCVEATYGVPMSSLFVLAPGAAALFVASGKETVLMGLTELKLIAPIGRFAPYTLLGVGIGTNTAIGDAGPAARIGLGVRYEFTASLGAALESAYQTVSSHDFLAIGLGPIVRF
jgi:hypothetical protein